MDRNRIVVGHDGSAPSRSALRWAALEAARRDVPLHVLTAYPLQWPTSRFDGALEATVRGAYERIVVEAVEEARAVAEGIHVSGNTAVGDPAQLLVQAGRRASMIVVGNRGHGGFGSLLLGSVGQRVATHSSTPVVVVRGRGDTAIGTVVVGVDGSAAADHALGLAFEEAARRGCALVAVRAYTVPVPAWGMYAVPVVYDPEDIEKAAGQDLQAALAAWRDKYPSVPVEVRVGPGSPAKMLVDASTSAGLVVVGTRGHGGLAGTLLGSVSLQLLHHADCPVLIAHRPPQPESLEES